MCSERLKPMSTPECSTLIEQKVAESLLGYKSYDQYENICGVQRQMSEVKVIHYHNYIIKVKVDANLFFWSSYLLSNNGEAVLDLQVSAAQSDPDGELALGNDPLLADNVPVAQIPALKLEADGLLVALLKVYLLEATELADRCTGWGGRGKADVELGNGGTGTVTGVGNGDSDVVERLPQSGVTAGLDGQLLGHGCDVVLQRGRLNVGDLKCGV